MNESEFVWAMPPVPPEDPVYREWDGSYVSGMEEDPSDIPTPGPTPPIGLSVSLAAAASLLKMTADEFDEFVRPHLLTIDVSGRELAPIRELERWLEWSGAELL